MKTISINLYQFNELTPEAQKAAIRNLSDINTIDQWWDYLYEDAENVGLKLTGFDIDRGACNGHIMNNGFETAMAICDNHGEETQTYKLAKQYLDDLPDIRKGTPEALQAEGIDYLTEEAFETRFLKKLCSAYLVMLREQYEYLTSDEAIKETIEANEYDFLENGTLYGKGGN